MNAAELRKMASQLRQEDVLRKEEKRVKCAQIILAAAGLDVLRRKLGVSNA